MQLFILKSRLTYTKIVSNERNIHKIIVNRICTRLQWRRIVQRAFCKHDEIASPDEFTSPYVTLRQTENVRNSWPVKLNLCLPPMKSMVTFVSSHDFVLFNAFPIEKHAILKQKSWHWCSRRRRPVWWCCASARSPFQSHYSDVIMSTIASQITSFTIVYSTVYSGTDRREHQSPA